MKDNREPPKFKGKIAFYFPFYEKDMKELLRRSKLEEGGRLVFEFEGSIGLSEFEEDTIVIDSEAPLSLNIYLPRSILETVLRERIYMI